jgi:hypothetical protein
MATGHPIGPPDLFLDRSLGRHQVPSLLRAAGLRLQTLSEFYGTPADELVADVEWLRVAGTHGWPVLMKDQRIRYAGGATGTYRPRRPSVLSHRRKPARRRYGRAFLVAIADIEAACAQAGPFLYAVTPRGLRRLDLP